MESRKASDKVHEKINCAGKILKKINSAFINDGKVVMVRLNVVDKTTGNCYTEVGRATCDLESDVFDLNAGICLAESRALEKALKKVLKFHKGLLKDAVLAVENETDIVNNAGHMYD